MNVVSPYRLCRRFGRPQGIVDAFADNRIDMTGSISHEQPIVTAARFVKKAVIGRSRNQRGVFFLDPESRIVFGQEVIQFFKKAFG